MNSQVKPIVYLFFIDPIKFVLITMKRRDSSLTSDLFREINNLPVFQLIGN